MKTEEPQTGPESITAWDVFRVFLFFVTCWLGFQEFIAFSNNGQVSAYIRTVHKSLGGEELSNLGVAGVTTSSASSSRFLDSFDEVSGCVASQVGHAKRGDMVSAGSAKRAPRVRPLALAIPLHRPHFPFFLNFLEPRASQGDALGWDLFPVFTSEEEAEEFEEFLAAAVAAAPAAGPGNATHLASYRTLYHPLVLSWDPVAVANAAHVWGWKWMSDQGTPIPPPFVLYKNYHALAILHACYDLVSVLDAEVDILSPAALLPAMRGRVEGGRVLAGLVPRYRYFNEWSSCFFEPSDLDTLRGFSRDNQLYSWWSDVPVVVGRDVPGFLAYAGYPARFPNPGGKEFAYLSYELWKVARGEWAMVDLSDAPVYYTTCGSLEMMWQGKDYEAVREAFPPGPRWVTKAFCTLNPTLCQAAIGAQDIVLLFHLDRGEELLRMAATQECLALHFNKDPALNPKVYSQSCTWFNGTSRLPTVNTSNDEAWPVPSPAPKVDNIWPQEVN